MKLIYRPPKEIRYLDIVLIAEPLKIRVAFSAYRYHDDLCWVIDMLQEILTDQYLTNNRSIHKLIT